MVVLTLHNQTFFYLFVQNKHLSGGLTEHNFPENFVQNTINKLNGGVDLHNNILQWYH